VTYLSDASAVGGSPAAEVIERLDTTAGSLVHRLFSSGRPGDDAGPKARAASRDRRRLVRPRDLGAAARRGRGDPAVADRALQGSPQIAGSRPPRRRDHSRRHHGLERAESRAQRGRTRRRPRGTRVIPRQLVPHVVWQTQDPVPTRNFIGLLGHAVIGRETPDRADCECRLAASDAQGRLSPHARREATSEWRESNHLHWLSSKATASPFPTRQPREVGPRVLPTRRLRGAAFVPVMESADLGNGNHSPVARWRRRSWVG
jgi:hypothetical protein